jgi:hypothetical protein
MTAQPTESRKRDNARRKGNGAQKEKSMNNQKHVLIIHSHKAIPFPIRAESKRTTASLFAFVFFFFFCNISISRSVALHHQEAD